MLFLEKIATIFNYLSLSNLFGLADLIGDDVLRSQFLDKGGK
jgi:hypothetical protein